MSKELEYKKWRLYESAMIKSIRRGLVDDAIYWAANLYKFGKQASVWRRIFIHLSEDVGLANTYLPATIRALHENYQFLQASGKGTYDIGEAQKLPYIHAVMLLASSKKSRAVDNATIVHFDLPSEYREVPDYAYDFHSPLGKRMGRNLSHFFNIASQIENEGEFEDQWKGKARRLINKKETNE